MDKKLENFDYGRKTAQLEEILAKLQDSTTTLDEAIKLHAEGKVLIGEIENYLQKAEIEIKKHVVSD